MGMTKDEKIARAIVLRDAALIAVKRGGTWEDAGPVKLLTAHTGTLSICYRTPFQRFPGAATHVDYADALADQHGETVTLPYGLDIWAPKKVMSIEGICGRC